MNLENNLKKFKNIQADPEYAKRSRDFILHTPAPTTYRTFWHFVLHNLEIGAAVGLTGIVLFLILGGSSLSTFLSPFRLSSLDPAGLRAEADAIDIQIQLTNLGVYKETTPKLMENAASTTNNIPAISAAAKKEAEKMGITASTSDEGVVQIDDALKALSE